jgi:hypothetical protein
VRGLRASRRRLATVIGAGALLLAAGCGPEVKPLDPSLGAGMLTPEANDTYGLTLADGVVTASAPETNTGGNTRIAFWRVADQPSTDQQTCATWVNAQSRLQQQGAALRVRSANGRTTAITVTDNIFYLARWAFNVHVMDSAAQPVFRQIASFDLGEAFRTAPGAFTVWPYPWRMCARVVGDTLSFIVWPLTVPEPAWNDPRYGGSVRLPAGWGQPGIPGWYVGHLEPGDSVGFTDMTTADVSPEPPPTAPSTTTTSPSRSASGQDPSGVVAPEPTAPPRAPTWIPRAP